MNPDQTAPLSSLISVHIVCNIYKLPKNIGGWEEQRTNIVTGGLWVKYFTGCMFSVWMDMLAH